MTKLKITDLRADSTVRQVVRGKIDDAVVERYTTAMRAGLWDFGRSLKPITAFFDGEGYWLADGYHRVIAAKSVPWLEVEVEVRRGTRRDALWYAFSSNAQHGHARGRDDVGRILKAIFEDEEWRAVPLSEISRHTRIPETTVRRSYSKRVASSPVAEIAKPAARTVTRGGTTYSMNTRAIGKASDPTPAHKPPAIEAPKPVAPVVIEPVGELRLAPSLPGARAAADQHTDVDAEAERELFVAAIRPLLDGLIAQGKKNNATMSTPTVAHLAAQLEALLVGWDFAAYGQRLRRCRLCGEPITHGKLVMLGGGPAHWTCQTRDEEFQRWLKARADD